MKKTTQTKKATPAKQTRTAKQITPAATQGQSFHPWSLSIYVYWFIILFFIAATFYILGRSQATHKINAASDNNVEITEEALMQAPDFFAQGKTQLVAGNVDAAIIDLSAAIDAGDAPVDAYILRAEAYMQAGDYSKSLNDLDKAISMNSMNAVAYYDRSLVNSRMENYAAALDDINNALAAAAEQPSDIISMRDLYAKRGQLNLWMRNWEGAIADYTNSLARPEGVISPTVYAERAEAYTATGNYQEAINDYSAAVRVISEQIQGVSSAEQSESLSSRAMLYFEKSAALNLNLNNIDAARSDLESARTIAMALNDTETVDRLQNLLNELNR